MRAMVLAAGRGRRLRPLTDSCPKPLLEAGGRPLLEYHLRSLAAADITEVVINTSWLADQIESWVGDGHRFGVAVTISFEGPTALETGGGIVRALPLLGDEAFIVVNGDTFTDYPLDTLQAPEGDDLARLVLVPNPAHNEKGDFGLDEGRITNEGQPRHTFAGLATYRPEFFAAAPSGAFALAPLLRQAARDGRLAGELFEGRWCDVGTPERLEALDGWLRGDAPFPE